MAITQQHQLWRDAVAKLPALRAQLDAAARAFDTNPDNPRFRAVSAAAWVALQIAEDECLTAESNLG